MSSLENSQQREDDEAIRALFWASLTTDGVAADILIRTCGDIIATDPGNEFK